MSNGALTPEPGRVVHFYPGEAESVEGWNLPERGVPLAATIAGVVNDVIVNLSVVDYHGVQHSRQMVPLVTGELLAHSGAYARWMPYQIAQTKNKAEADVSRAERIEQGVNTVLRKDCIQMALHIVLQGSSPGEILAMAQEFEQHILGRPLNPPMKEKA